MSHTAPLISKTKRRKKTHERHYHPYSSSNHKMYANPHVFMADKQRDAIRSRLRKEAESQGIDGGRIVWAKWVSKSDHLSRHAVADLFLDTLTYGAHSTATDALAGGLPLLTLAGEMPLL